MKLPPSTNDQGVSLEAAIRNRRSVRSFQSEKLSVEQLSQLLCAAQGITESSGYKRAAPSAGALYPMDVYAAIGSSCVQGLEAGVYHYIPSEHSLETIVGNDCRLQLAKAALSQMWMARAPVNLIITAEYERVNIKYGKRGFRYAMIEAGHIGQNIFLMAEALALGAGIVGAFDDQEVIRVLNIPQTHEPLLIMPVGRRKN